MQHEGDKDKAQKEYQEQLDKKIAELKKQNQKLDLEIQKLEDFNNNIALPLFETAASLTPFGPALNAGYAISGYDLMGNKLTNADKAFNAAGAILPAFKIFKSTSTVIRFLQKASHTQNVMEVTNGVVEVSNGIQNYNR